MAGSKLGTDEWLAVGRDGTKAHGMTRRAELETWRLLTLVLIVHCMCGRKDICWWMQQNERYRGETCAGGDRPGGEVC